MERSVAPSFTSPHSRWIQYMLETEDQGHTLFVSIMGTLFCWYAHSFGSISPVACWSYCRWRVFSAVVIASSGEEHSSCFKPTQNICTTTTTLLCWGPWKKYFYNSNWSLYGKKECWKTGLIWEVGTRRQLSNSCRSVSGYSLYNNYL
jgi:hypothetical protein